MHNKIDNRIIFATNNSHKLKEIREILKDRFDVVGLSEIGFSDEIEETGNSLQENALIKARVIRRLYNTDCFSDDTGLEVFALDNAPGVKSARYAGEHCNAEDNIKQLLSDLEGINDRRARFRTSIALIIDGKEYLFEGEVNGCITSQVRGLNGFGYDPIFIPEGYDKTFAEISSKEKSKISHRALATTRLVSFLLNI